MWPVVFVRRVAWSVYLSVGQSVIIFIPAIRAKPIEMPFAVWTLVGPRNHVLDGVQMRMPRVKGVVLRGNIICTPNGLL